MGFRSAHGIARREHRPEEDGAGRSRRHVDQYDVHVQQPYRPSARCHYHKFDPIPQEDYFRLQAVFAGVERADRIVFDPAAQQRAKFEKGRQTRIAALPAGWHSAFSPTPDAKKWVQVDLGKTMPIDEIRLVPCWPADMDDAGYGFPPRFRVDVSDDPTFAKFQTVLDHSLKDDFGNPGSTIVRIPGGGKKAQYVRMTAFVLARKTTQAFIFALAEMEVDSDGRNVAPSATVTSSDSLENSRWSKKNLIDSFDGRKWLRLPADADLRDKLERIADELSDLTKQGNALPTPEKVYAISSIKPRIVNFLNRGEVDKPREEVGPGAASCVKGLEFDFTAKAKEEGLAASPSPTGSSMPAIRSRAAPSSTGSGNIISAGPW